MIKPLWSLFCAGSALAILATPPGDLEVYCSASGSQFTERWPGTSVRVPWETTITSTSAGERSWVGPEAPALNTFSGALRTSRKPGVESLVAGAGNWSDVRVVDGVDDAGNLTSSTGLRATRLTLSTAPSLVERSIANFPAGQLFGPVSYSPPVAGQNVCCYGRFYLPYTSTSLINAVLHTMVAQTASGLPARNTVDFIRDGRYWFEFLGQSTNALAVSPVQVSNGDIVEFDIGFNDCRYFWQRDQMSCQFRWCLTFVPGNNYNWIAESREMRRLLGDPGGVDSFSILGQPQSIQSPQIGFADVEGVATHEFGHALGLGHSYQDGRSNLLGLNPGDDVTDVPTMFPRAQSATLVEAIKYADFQENPGELTGGSWVGALPNDPTTWPLPSPAAQFYADVVGVLGTSARTLELDDVAALSRGYPSAAVAPNTVGVAGAVRLAGALYRGALVTALSTSFPDVVVASTLTYENGRFDLGALPPGKYALRVEPFPRGMLNSNFVLPSFITSCPIDTTDFPAEYWNKDDAPDEYSSEVTFLDMSVPGTRLVADFQLDAGPAGSWSTPVLSPSSATAVGGTAGNITIEAPFSANRRQLPLGRAYRAQQFGATGFNVTVRIDGSSDFGGGSLMLIANRDKQIDTRFGQLAELVPDMTLIPGGVVTGNLSAAGVWTGTVPLSAKAGLYRDNVQLTAYVLDAAGNVAVTNSVGIWFSY